MSGPRRIVVAVDASSDVRATAAAAAGYAARLGASIDGFFVQDQRLIDLARVAVARESSVLSGRGDLLDPAALQHQLHTRAARVERLMRREAERRGVAFAFTTCVGGCAAAIVESAVGADLLVLGRLADPISTRRRATPQVRRVVAEQAGAVLFPGPYLGDDEPATLVVRADGQLEQAIQDALGWLDPRRAIALWLLESQEPGVEQRARDTIAAAGRNLVRLRDVSTTRLDERIAAKPEGALWVLRRGTIDASLVAEALDAATGTVLLL